MLSTWNFQEVNTKWFWLDTNLMLQFLIHFLHCVQYIAIASKIDWLFSFYVIYNYIKYYIISVCFAALHYKMIQIVKIVKPKCKHVIGGEKQLLYKHTYITLKNYILVKVGPHDLPFFSVFGTLKCYVIFKKSKCKICFSSVCLIHLYSLQFMTSAVTLYL